MSEGNILTSGSYDKLDNATDTLKFVCTLLGYAADGDEDMNFSPYEVKGLSRLLATVASDLCDIQCESSVQGGR